ncbi:MAG: phosphoribosylanthranilate isomerase [Bacteroidia bacterium]|nr:phosphoribosylanthranilate isomerase [Bacteroidia bacterium]
MKKIKVCGLREPENIDDVLSLSPDYIGFIFYPKSSRHIGGKLPTFYARQLDEAKKVGVFVDEVLREIKEFVHLFGLDVVQLHGKENPAFCAKVGDLGVEVIKVFSVGESFDFDQLTPYREVVDFFLFDTKGELPGGNGTAFDWTILEKYDGKVPYFLSGGIGAADGASLAALDLPGLYGVDVNSKFEIKPGLKDVKKLNTFFQEIREAD